MAEKSNLLVGAHVSMSAKQYLLGSLADSIGYRANALMIYTGAPQNAARAPLTSLFIKEFQEGCAKNGIALENVVVHAPYLINLCSGNPEVREKSVAFLRSELERTKAIGGKYLVLHPGSDSGKMGREPAIAAIAKGIDLACKGLKDVYVCLETMAGKGSEIGGPLADLKAIMDQTKTPVYVCVDTCHMNDAGYDISKPQELLREIDAAFGLDKVKVVHLNDSKNPLGARKDRHENIGYGTIGATSLIKFANLKELAGVPKILETPWDKDADYYAQEIEILKSGKWRDFRAE